MINVMQNLQVKPFAVVECVNNPTSYTNNSYGIEQLMIDGGAGVELQVSDGMGTSVTLRNTYTVCLRPFVTVTVSYAAPPNSVKVMALS